MKLTVKDIDVILKALYQYMDKVLEDDLIEWEEIIMVIVNLIKLFQKLRKEKLLNE